MAVSDDLINFDLIEQHKENIQQLPGGRSAKHLTNILSPHPSGQPNLDGTKTLNDAIRQEYELELQSIADSDDPLDIYDRYVKWTLNAYPSAQATPQSQLLPLLERATKAFLTSSHYKNDPRYLKLWLHYIRLFSDAPRETFAFLARHHVGETLGLFYEEFAAWLEGAGRWNQAEEVYKMGIEKEARPAERLMRKYNHFQQRFEARPQNADEPSSPALPTVRPALAAKIDPFAPSPPEDPQARARNAQANPSSRSGKPKMAIFSDTDNAAPAPAQTSSRGWDSIGSMKDRKKENTIEAKPWTGETLKAGGRVGTASKMEVFKDPSLRNHEPPKHRSSKSPSDSVNPRTGRPERAFVNMKAVCPNNEEEFSFEELRAMSRGWANREWRRKPASTMRSVSGNAQRSPQLPLSSDPVDVENLSQCFHQNLSIIDTSTQSMVGMPEPKLAKQRRLKVREVKQEVQTVKTRLESPTGPKMRRKGSAEPTMTFHSKAATNDIYDMFNQPPPKPEREDTQSGDDTDFGDDDTYSTAGESTGTGRISAATSEFGDDTLASIRTDQNTGSQPDSVSPWSEFTASKHLPKLDKGKSKSKHRHINSDDLTENMSSSQNQTQTGAFGGSFDTQAIAAIADQDFDDLDTKAIAMIAGDHGQTLAHVEEEEEELQVSEELKTPVEPPSPEHVEIHNKPHYVPLPPENYEPTPFRPYRDPSEVAQNKLPFMTPIVERTESSLASTVYKDADYFNSKTPSRSAHGKAPKDDSPSKLKLDELLMSSPQKDSPQAGKRRLSHTGATEEELITSSPQKKQHVSPIKNDKPSFAIVKNEDAKGTQKDVVRSLPAPTQQPPKPREASKGPIITDLQCNPCDPSLRQQILNAIDPPLPTYEGYYDTSSEIFNHHASLKSYADKLAKQKPTKFSPRKSQNENKAITKTLAPTLNFKNTTRVYAVKRELGKGAFAPVYLVDSYSTSDSDSQAPIDPTSSTPQRSDLEALKSESPPHTLVWEFHILRLLRSRLPSASRVLSSIIDAHECHLYCDEAYLVLSYSPQGTLLDLVNVVKGDNVRIGKNVEGTGLDEAMTMFFAVELLRTLSALHENNIIHGDLKADNCLVRFDSAELTTPYDREGKGGWAAKGLKLIDFGRGIDVDERVFDTRVKFMADWEAHREECNEVREGRLWKWVADWYGAAGVLHSLLFGKYMETVPVQATSRGFRSSVVEEADDDVDGEGDELAGGGGGGAREVTIAIHSKKQYTIKEPLKRYWEKELWTEVFSVLLNTGSEDDREVRGREMARVRVLMEEWLEREGERGGRDLRGAVRRGERLVGGLKK